MKITVTDDAAKKLQRYTDDSNAVLLLDFDDGVGALSKVGVCSLNSDFRILIVSKDMDYKKDYNEVIDSNIGKFYYKGYSKMYMDDNMKISLNTNNSLLRLTGDNSGELMLALSIQDFR